MTTHPRKSRQMFLDQHGDQRILIERREIIGEIVPDPSAQHSMLTAAFLKIGEWFSDNDDPRGAQLGFEYGERQFRVALEPDKNWVEAQAKRDEEPEY